MVLLVSRRFISGMTFFITLIYQAEFCFPFISTKSVFQTNTKIPKPLQILLQIVFLKIAAFPFLNHPNNPGSESGPSI